MTFGATSRKKSKYKIKLENIPEIKLIIIIILLLTCIPYTLKAESPRKAESDPTLITTPSSWKENLFIFTKRRLPF